MDDFSDKLNKILSDPKSMEQIMSLAKSFGTQQQTDSPSPDIAPDKTDTQTDSQPMAEMLRSLANSPAGQAFLSGEQERIRLLKALQPYLGEQKRQKLNGVISAMESVGAIGSLAKLL